MISRSRARHFPADALAGYAEALNKRERWDDLDRAAVFYAVNRRLIQEQIHVVA